MADSPETLFKLRMPMLVVPAETILEWAKAGHLIYWNPEEVAKGTTGHPAAIVGIAEGPGDTNDGD